MVEKIKLWYFVNGDEEGSVFTATFENEKECYNFIENCEIQVLKTDYIMENGGM